MNNHITFYPCLDVPHRQFTDPIVLNEAWRVHTRLFAKGDDWDLAKIYAVCRTFIERDSRPVPVNRRKLAKYFQRVSLAFRHDHLRRGRP